MKNGVFERFDWLLTLCVTVLAVFSVMFIYSSGINSEGELTSKSFIRQIVYFIIAFLIMLLVAFVDYRKYARYVPYIFAAFIFLLMLVLVLGFLFPRYFSRHGAKSWLGIGSLGVQPSEFCKIAFIMFLAYFFDKTKNGMSQLKRLFLSALILIIPAGLILVQPDFGTAFIYIPVFLVMCIVAGIPLKYVAFLFFTGALTIIFTFVPLWQQYITRVHTPVVTLLTSNLFFIIEIVVLNVFFGLSLLGYYLFPEFRKIFYYIAYVMLILLISVTMAKIFPHFLKPYQIKRLVIFLNPDLDPLDSAWNIINSRIAIGSGNIWGKGFLLGTQSHLQYLPEQSTDFIFSILAEELGFKGAFFVFLVYLTILVRIIYILKNTINTYGYYIGVGIISLLFFHFIINVGMVMGIMPVTGIPLLFMSYGGSSLLTSMVAVGIVMSIRYHKFEF